MSGDEQYLKIMDDFLENQMDTLPKISTHFNWLKNINHRLFTEIIDMINALSRSQIACSSQQDAEMISAFPYKFDECLKDSSECLTNLGEDLREFGNNNINLGKSLTNMENNE